MGVGAVNVSGLKYKKPDTGENILYNINQYNEYLKDYEEAIVEIKYDYDHPHISFEDDAEEIAEELDDWINSPEDGNWKEGDHWSWREGNHREDNIQLGPTQTPARAKIFSLEDYWYEGRQDDKEFKASLKNKDTNLHFAELITDEVKEDLYKQATKSGDEFDSYIQNQIEELSEEYRKGDMDMVARALKTKGAKTGDLITAPQDQWSHIDRTGNLVRIYNVNNIELINTRIANYLNPSEWLDEPILGFNRFEMLSLGPEYPVGFWAADVVEDVNSLKLEPVSAQHLLAHMLPAKAYGHNDEIMIDNLKPIKVNNEDFSVLNFEWGGLQFPGKRVDVARQLKLYHKYEKFLRFGWQKHTRHRDHFNIPAGSKVTARVRSGWVSDTHSTPGSDELWIIARVEAAENKTTYKYNSGLGIYYGQMKGVYFNGYGTITFSSGNKYVGGFKNDKFDGYGAYTYTNCRKYVGEYKNGKQSGKYVTGKIAYKTSDNRYTIVFEDGKVREHTYTDDIKIDAATRLSIDIATPTEIIKYIINKKMAKKPLGYGWYNDKYTEGRLLFKYQGKTKLGKPVGRV